MSRYYWDLYDEELRLKSVLFLKISSSRFTALAHTLESMAILAKKHFVFDGSDWLLAYQDGLELCGLIIREIRHCARGYYEVWIAHHMIRVIVKAYLDIDVAAAWILYKKYVRATNHENP